MRGATAVSGRAPAGVHYSRPMSPIGPLLLINLWLITGVVIPVVFTEAVDNLTDLSVISAWGLVLLTSSQVARVIATGRPELVDAAFWTFAYAFMTLPALAQFSVDAYPLSAPVYPPGVKVIASLVILAGIIAYIWGRRVARTSLERVSPCTAAEAGRAGRALAMPRVKMLGVFGLLIVAYAIARYGLTPFFTSRDALTEAFFGPAPTGTRYFEVASKAGGASMQLLIQVPVFVSAYLLLYTRRCHGSEFSAEERNRIWPRSLLLALVVANLVVNNPVSNGRLWFGTVLLAMTTAVVGLDRKLVVRSLLGLLLFLSLFSMDRLDAFRRTGAADFTSTGLAVELVSGPDFASPQQVVNGLLYVEEYGYTLGRQLAGTVFIAVPRAVWLNKPIDTGDVVAPEAGFNVSAPLWTEGWVDFGLAGVFAFLMAYGWVGGRLDGAYSRSAGSASAFAPLMPILAGYGLFILRGSLMPALGNFFPVILLFFLLMRRQSALPGETGGCNSASRTKTYEGSSNLRGQ